MDGMTAATPSCADTNKNNPAVLLLRRARASRRGRARGIALLSVAFEFAQLAFHQSQMDEGAE